MPNHDVWQKKMLRLGGGGFIGSLPESRSETADVLSLGYAYGDSNLGHSSTAEDASWGWDATMGTFRDKERIDFGYHTTHITTVITRHITEAYYDEAVEYSFFEGCSTGGRQGLVSVQRYPEDFDGIIAGAPAFAMTQGMLNWIAVQQVMFPDPANWTASL